MTVPPWPIVPIFQSTLPGWGAPDQHAHDAVGQVISIHAPRMGSDVAGSVLEVFVMIFQSTLPGWGATASFAPSPPCPVRFQSTLPGWGATRFFSRSAGGSVGFQSTLPGWGATLRGICRYACPRNFNPRSPDGERLSCVRDNAAYADISIHAPRMGSDSLIHSSSITPSYFNPRSPDGERQGKQWQRRLGSNHISIHAPRMGSDRISPKPPNTQDGFQSTLPGWGATCLRSPVAVCFTYFNPRSPDGERPHPRSAVIRANYFNPRSPDGERRRAAAVHGELELISIHAPRMGSDFSSSKAINGTPKFQSTLPGWGATPAQRAICSMVTNFNPRSPDGERRGYDAVHHPAQRNFNPRSPDGERPVTFLRYLHQYIISIHAPRMGSDLAMPIWPRTT